MNLEKHKNNILENGFTIFRDIFSEDEIENIIEVIQKYRYLKRNLQKIGRSFCDKAVFKGDSGNQRVDF